MYTEQHGSEYTNVREQSGDSCVPLRCFRATSHAHHAEVSKKAMKSNEKDHEKRSKAHADFEARQGRSLQRVVESSPFGGE